MPIFAFVTNCTPSASIRSTLLCTTFNLSVFILGTPYIIKPPIRSDLSKTVTECPFLFSSSAAASPAGPLPTIATFFLQFDCQRFVSQSMGIFEEIVSYKEKLQPSTNYCRFILTTLNYKCYRTQFFEEVVLEPSIHFRSPCR